MNLRVLTVTLLLTAVLAALLGCGNSKPPGPKEAVIAMFGAMEKDDKASLAHLLDLAELMRNINEDYALQTDQPRRFTNPEQILDDLTGNGVTKQRWFSHQRIVNKVDIEGQQATVEVTFQDKVTNKAYLTKFGLHVVNDRWKIYSFNAYSTN